MIPHSQATGKPKRADGTDSCTIHCDDGCGVWEYVSPSSTTVAEIRAQAAKNLWTTAVEGKKTLDICPECSVPRRRRARQLTMEV